MVRFCRSLGGIVWLAALFALGALGLILRRPATREQRANWLHGFCARTLPRMGIAFRQHGTYPERGVVISNHIGYLDIIAFAALHRCVFVSKSEIRSWPFIGWMTTMAGTVFVERGRGGSANRAKGEMQAVADSGIPVVFFPEGTSSDASTVLPFRSGLLTESIAAGQPITAAFVAYRLTRGNGPDVTIADRVAYWDDTPIFTHIFRLVGLRGIEVDVSFADAPIAFSPAAATDRRIAATEARAAVMELGGVAEPEPVAT